MPILHIHNVQTAPNVVEVGRFLKDVCLPFQRSLGGWQHPGRGAGGTFCDTLSSPLSGVNRKWHSSSSAFPPSTSILSVFCLVSLFLYLCWLWWAGRDSGEGSLMEWLSVCMFVSRLCVKPFLKYFHFRDEDNYEVEDLIVAGFMLQ